MACIGSLNIELIGLRRDVLGQLAYLDFTSRLRTQEEALLDSAPPARWRPAILGMG